MTEQRSGRLAGKVVAITGAASGIGFARAKVRPWRCSTATRRHWTGRSGRSRATERARWRCRSTSPNWARFPRPSTRSPRRSAGWTTCSTTPAWPSATTPALTIEGVPNIPMFRQNTAAFVHDLPDDGSSNVDGDNTYVRVQVLTNAAALDRDKQLAVVSQFTDLVVKAAGDDGLANRTWVLLTEAIEGGWGLGGHANTNAELVAWRGTLPGPGGRGRASVCRERCTARSLPAPGRSPAPGRPADPAPGRPGPGQGSRHGTPRAPRRSASPAARRAGRPDPVSGSVARGHQSSPSQSGNTVAVSGP